MTLPRDKSWNDAPLVIAHRGASLQAPENTIAAFRMATEIGADAIEMDAKLTKDGRVVLHHDLTLERTTDGNGSLKSHTLDAIKELDAGSHFGEQFAGERIPTLEEVIENIGEAVLLNIELSNYDSTFDVLPIKVVEIVRNYSVQSRVLFSSFNPIALIRAGRAAPEIRRGLLIRPEEPKWVRSLLHHIVSYQALHPQFEMVDAKLIIRCRSAKKRVFVWTVNTSERISRMLRVGVDGVITDDPELALRCVADR